jgi:FkbM family methyltransferase
MKRDILRGAAALARGYLQHFPLQTGKQQVWEHAIRPYLAWRDMTFRTKTQAGFLLDVNTADVVQRYAYFFGSWEPVFTDYIKRMLRPGDVVIDIGANIGYHSLLASRVVGPSGRVFAIEASPSICAKLRHNVALNAADNVTVINVAIFRERMELPLHIHNSSNSGATTIVSEVAQRRDTEIEAIIQAMPLAEAMPIVDILRARLIKIDVEGAEWPVVQGIIDLLPRLSAATELVIEIDSQALQDQGTSVDEFLSLFESAGFRPYVFGERLDVYENRIKAFLGNFSSEVHPLSDRGFDSTDVLFRRN